MHSDFRVFVYLGIAFAAVGVHLFFYSKRQHRCIRRFASAEGYAYRTRDDGSLARRLDEAFGIAEGGCARAFERIRDVVALSGGEIFRCVELLDLTSYASVQNPRHARVAVRISAPSELHGIFHITSEFGVHQRYPTGSQSAAPHVQRYLVSANIAHPPHPISLSFANGQVLAYLEPAVAGSVTESDLCYLADMAAQLSQQAVAKLNRR